jgi:hypothetical protein
LTLFLSIELGKAAAELDVAEASDTSLPLVQQQIDLAKAKITLFTEQLEESNPVLTSITDAMSAEGLARDVYTAATNDDSKAAALAEFNAFKAVKEEGNQKLQGISMKYKLAARALREQGEALVKA